MKQCYYCYYVVVITLEFLPFFKRCKLKKCFRTPIFYMPVDFEDQTLIELKRAYRK